MKQLKNTFISLNSDGSIGPAKVEAGCGNWYETSVPCQASCPAGTDVPGYLKAIREGHFDLAYRINLKDNVFPAVLGRICTRPCEPACRHGREGLGESVAICFSKRSAADFKKNHQPVVLDPMFPESGKKIAVIGAGPAGLSAARDLALFGHRVVVYEKHTHPGGMLVQGIPEFRLPRDLVEAEIQQILKLGVELHCNIEIGGDVTLTDLSNDYDAVLLSTGAHLPWTPDFKGTDLDGVYHGFDFMKDVNNHASADIGETVVVVGGGFTAIDCAQVSNYLGAGKVELVYRKDASGMRCTPEEISRMKKEGIDLKMHTIPEAFKGGRQVDEVTLKATHGDKRWNQETDTVLIATGQRRSFAKLDPELGPYLDKTLLNPATASYQPDSKRNLFCCGDARLGAASVIDAIGDARRCARSMDEMLTGQNRFVDELVVKDLKHTDRDRKHNLTPRQEEREQELSERQLNKELSLGLDENASQKEAWRCYMCNQKIEIDNEKCISCGLCLMAMPVEDCIVQIKTDDNSPAKQVHDFESYTALAVDQDRCIRCDACRESCPVNCISLQTVTPVTRPRNEP